MKKRLFLMLSLVIASSFILLMNGCMQIANGTGILTVSVTDSEWDGEIAVYPYPYGVYGTVGANGKGLPVATEKVEQGQSKEATFTLNAGNYNVTFSGEMKAVQIQEGEIVTITFDK